LPPDRAALPDAHYGVIPDVDPDTAIEQNTELAAYLESELDVSVDLRTTSDYASLVQAMTAEQVDLGYFGASLYSRTPSGERDTDRRG